MKKCLIFTGLFLIIICLTGLMFIVEFEELSRSDYFKTPRLASIDDFEECKSLESDSDLKSPLYCMVKAVIDHPTKRSTPYSTITEYSSYSNQYFNHRILTRGICMKKCHEIHEKMNETEKAEKKYLNDNSLIVGDGVTPAIAKLNAINKICNVCVNKELLDNYGFIAKTKIDYCITENEERSFDLVHYLFIAGLSTILFFFLSSLIYERYKDYPRVQKIFINAKSFKALFKAFSIQENWNQLTRVTKNEDYTALEPFKCVILFMLVFSYVYRHIASMPFANPIYIEESFLNNWMLFLDHEFVTNLFLVTCGIQLSFFLIPLIETSSSVWHLLKKLVGSKFRKLLALYSGFVLFHSSFLQSMVESPFWNNHALKEQKNCRESGLLSILTFNNYAKHGEMCLESSWILSADFHLSILGFFIICFLVKFPKWQKLKSFFIILMSLAFVATLISFRKLNIYSFVVPEILRNFPKGGDRKFTEGFYASHMNCGNFIIGTLFGSLVSVVTKFFISTTNVLLEMSFINMFAYSCAIMIISYALGVVVYLILEAPLRNITNFRSLKDLLTHSDSSPAKNVKHHLKVQ
ncbi:CLUMA_CG012117, isoform A [Clunio marinus]|uniref:CLUMA_CG012117, isoform A n=1 Tax=Clunio marinus TaxID=568069 RepID=A0A1J1IEA0_9DIPT|nr:CLUMA_CG012117, isoform A [Clunio marinus]